MPVKKFCFVTILLAIAGCTRGEECDVCETFNGRVYSKEYIHVSVSPECFEVNVGDSVSIKVKSGTTDVQVLRTRFNGRSTEYTMCEFDDGALVERYHGLLCDKYATVGCDEPRAHVGHFRNPSAVSKSDIEQRAISGEIPADDLGRVALESGAHIMYFNGVLFFSTEFILF